MYGSTQVPKIRKDKIFIGKELVAKAPKIEGVPSGIEGLDDLFFIIEAKKKKIEKKSLKGIPKYSVLQVTGVSDTGKSIMVEQFAVTQAHRGEKVVFITVETPAIFTINSLKLRASALGYDFDKIDENLILIDVATDNALRENIPDLLATMSYAYDSYGAKFTVIDSITGLFENKEMTARSIIRRFYNLMKESFQTALVVSQKRGSHEELTAEAAGGYAVGHILDGTLVLAKELINSSYKANLYHKKIGEIIRLFRIDGCRLSAHDTDTHHMQITDTGLIVIGESIVEK